MTNSIIRQETEGACFGVRGRYFAVVAPETGPIRNQKFTTERRRFGSEGETAQATLRFDDECRNGHATFSITGQTWDGYGRAASFGCVHEEIAEAFPELAHLVKWHLVSTDGPMHYVANTVYHASNRDHNGLLKGEFRQLRNGKTGLPSWERVVVDAKTGEELSMGAFSGRYADATTIDDLPTIRAEWRPWGRIGEGKERDFEAARSCAVWPEATDEELMSDTLADKLRERLPGLLEAFKADMLAAGFLWR